MLRARPRTGGPARRCGQRRLRRRSSWAVPAPAAAALLDPDAGNPVRRIGSNVHRNPGELLSRPTLLHEYNDSRVAGFFHLFHVVSARLIADRQTGLDGTTRHALVHELLQCGPVPTVNGG